MTMDGKDEKFDGFSIAQTYYKYAGNHAIRADILVPQAPIHRKPKPVIVRFHGGGFVTGDSLWAMFWPRWLSDLALEKDAIVISPNYRLLPEATTPQLHEDIYDFWVWLQSPSLPEVFSELGISAEINLSQLLVVGDSAGGLLSISLALSHGTRVRAAIATYPCIDMMSADFMEPRRTPPLKHDVPESVYSDAIAAFQFDQPKSSPGPLERLDFMLATVQHGHLGKLYQRNTEGSPEGRKLWFPLEALKVPDAAAPDGGITILHGLDDTVVPIQSSRSFVECARKTFGHEVVTLTERDGEHGFDADSRLDEEWLRNALARAIDAWLQ